MKYLRLAALLTAFACCFDAMAATIVVNTVGSSASGCTLEDAIYAANQNLAVGTCAGGQAAPVTDTIAFAIPPFDGSVATIHAPALPEVTERVLIDGLTQPGSSCTGGFPTLRVAIVGQRGDFGLPLTGPDIAVRGLAIYGFASQIVVLGSETAQRVVIQCNVIGMDASGELAGAVGSTTTGILVSMSSDNVIGTDGDGVNDTAEGNWIAGNAQQIRILSLLEPAAGNRISGNRIGLNAFGTGAPAGAVQRVGILLAEGVRGALIGSDGNNVSDAVEQNVIAFNQASSGRAGGILVAEDSRENTIRGNSIYANAPLDIDLAFADEEGVSEPNDALDVDTGANEFQNRPVVASVLRIGGSTTLTGTLSSAPEAEFQIELFASTDCSPTGYGPGQRSMGRASMHTDASGNGSFALTAPSVAGRWFTALATDAAGNTSEFSACIELGLFQDGFEG